MHKWNSEALEALMNNEGMSRAELARRLGVATQSVVGWLPPNGPTRENAERVAEVFGVKADELYDDGTGSGSTLITVALNGRVLYESTFRGGSNA
jgi:transcriptional regulator with XRE-family HTH domain